MHGPLKTDAGASGCWCFYLRDLDLSEGCRFNRARSLRPLQPGGDGGGLAANTPTTRNGLAANTPSTTLQVQQGDGCTLLC